MTHYKVLPTISKAVGMGHAGHEAFCGLDLESAAAAGETFHFLGAVQENQPDWRRPKVDCPKCLAMYDAVINDYLSSRNP